MICRATLPNFYLFAGNVNLSLHATIAGAKAEGVRAERQGFKRLFIRTRSGAWVSEWRGPVIGWKDFPSVKTISEFCPGAADRSVGDFGAGVVPVVGSGGEKNSSPGPKS